MSKIQLRKIKRLLDPYIGKYIDTFMWRFRHYIFSDWRDGYLDENSLNHPHRELIIESISKRPHINSILELGTGNGINLINLSSKFTATKFIGIDINKKAILEGNKYISKHKISNVNLIVDDLFAIKKMESLITDYVITDAVLMYIDPEDLFDLFQEMLRISKSGLILCEQASSGNIYDDHWRHDYKEILSNLDGVDSFTMNKITEKHWSGDWIKYGYIIEVDKINA